MVDSLSRSGNNDGSAARWGEGPVESNRGVLCLLFCEAAHTASTSYSHESNEPPHVHVDKDDLSAKFWLEPVSLARNCGFSPKELRRIQRLVMEHQVAFLEAWHGHLGANG